MDLRQVARAENGHRAFVTRRIADETIIVPVAGGVGDLDAIFTLNEVGSHIWHLLDAPTTVQAIVESVAASFDVLPGDAERDVVQFLEKLETSGLIQPLGRPDRAAER